MRGSVESVLPLVMGVIIAGAILVIGFGIMGKAKGGVEDIWNTGANFQQRMDAMDGLYLSCDDWMTGAEKYKAEAILDTYKLPDRMRPYKYVWAACGENLEELSQRCYTQSDEDGKYCAGRGFLQASNDDVIDCLSTCSVIKDVYEKCAVSCRDDIISCFESLMQEARTSDFVKG
ncbi:MAG: hypothetical protein GOV00_04150, partial [Candidatus Altiarchaeota archaeon]|nr:hypothetical protein [Candidatus Altiarchaeota archaeon]